MDEIKIDQQEYYVWLACENGWNRAAGFIAEICGVQCSLVLLPTNSIELVVSDLLSGSRILAIPLSLLEVIGGDTKENTLVLLESKVAIIAKTFNATDIQEIKKRIAAKEAEYSKMFGKMPAFEKKWGIRKLELGLTEDGDIQTHAVSRYASADCIHWNWGANGEEEDSGKD